MPLFLFQAFLSGSIWTASIAASRGDWGPSIPGNVASLNWDRFLRAGDAALRS